MKTENRHINFQEPEGMMLLRYIKDTASNEEKSYIEAWLEVDENNKRILLQTDRKSTRQRTLRGNGELAEIH